MTELKSSDSLRNKRLNEKVTDESLQEEKHEILQKKKKIGLNEKVTDESLQNEKVTELKSSALQSMEKVDRKPKTYVLSHLAKFFMTDDGYTELSAFLNEHNLPDCDDLTLDTCEEAECIFYEETAEKMQDHLNVLIKMAWGDDDRNEDFPELCEEEVIPDSTEMHVQINGDTIENFANNYNLSNDVREELERIIIENEDCTGGTDDIYLELKK